MLTSLRSRRSAVLSLFAPTLILAAVACSSTPTTTPEPTPSTATSTSPGLKGDAFTAAYHEYDLKLAQCFRDQGLDIADPPADGYLDADGPEFQEAFPTCSARIGNPPVREITQSDRVEGLEKNLQQVSCLREKGYDLVEPTLEDPGFIPAEVTEEDFDACRVY